MKLLAVEYSHTDILQQLNRRAAESEREGEDVALHLVIEEQEKEIHLLREQVSEWVRECVISLERF